MEFEGTVHGSYETKLIGLKCKVILYNNLISILATDKQGQEVKTSHPFTSYEGLKFEHKIVNKNNLYKDAKINFIDINIIDSDNIFIGTIKVDEYQVDTIMKTYSLLGDTIKSLHNNKADNGINSCEINELSNNNQVSIENTLYWDIDSKKYYYGATIILRSVDIEHLEMEINVDNIRFEIKLNGIRKFTLIKEKISDSLHSINVFSKGQPDLVLNANIEKILKVESFFQHLNDLRFNCQKIFSKEVSSRVDELILSAEINDLLYNYVSKTDKKVFLDPIYLIYFENRLFEYFAGEIGLYSLSTDEYKLENVTSKLTASKENEIELQEVVNYINEYFLKLVKIIDGKYKNPSMKHSIYITWKLLRNVGMKYFYDLFHNEYGSFFNNIDSMSLRECIDTYTKIDTINIKSQENAAYLTYYLMHLCVFTNDSFVDNFNDVVTLLLKAIERIDLYYFEKALKGEPNICRFTIDDIDLMNGTEFEKIISDMFQKLGFSTIITKSTGDQGVDIIAEKNGRKLGIQAKCYSSTVSNSAIQEVVAGLNYYKLDTGIVVTNNFFTSSAISLAESNGIILWDRNILKEKLNSIYD